ncbi:hypothetical protein GGI03_002773, partial [Coemansia sp. RSA 2337]
MAVPTPSRGVEPHSGDVSTALLVDDLISDSELGSPPAHFLSRKRQSRLLSIGAVSLLLTAFIGGLLVVASARRWPCLGVLLRTEGTSTLISAKHGAVATDEPRCSVIGVDVLREGGNAIDAAIASTLCIGLMQAHSSGIGGGGFMLVRPPGGQSPVLIDFREMAGGAATEDMFIKDIKKAQIGGLAVGVPGEIAGLYSAHKRFGKLPWHRLFEPTIRLARDGYALNTIVYSQLLTMEQHILSSPGFNTTYTDGKGHLLKPGDTVRRPELADTLEAIARNGAKAFYQGRIAASLVKAVQSNGGILTTDDFANYAAVDRKPI